MSEDLSSKNSSSIQQANKKSVVATLFGVVATAGIFFIGQIVPVLLFVSVLTLAGFEEERVSDLLGDSLGLQFLLYVAISATIILLIRKLLTILKKPFKAFLLLRNKPQPIWLADIAVVYALYFVSFIIIAGVVGALTTVDVSQMQDLGISDPKSVTALLLTFAILVILPSITEELLFRGFLFNWLKSSAGVIVAYVLTSILFGLAHLEYDNLNWIATLDTLIFSVFLIYISQKHQSLYSAMFLHAIKNSVAFYVLFVHGGL